MAYSCRNNLQHIQTITNKQGTTSLNINHSYLLTPFKHNEKVVKNFSKLKVAAVTSTLGISTLVIDGTRSNKAHQYQCRDCGKIRVRK